MKELWRRENVEREGIERKEGREGEAKKKDKGVLKERD